MISPFEITVNVTWNTDHYAAAASLVNAPVTGVTLANQANNLIELTIQNEKASRKI